MLMMKKLSLFLSRVALDAVVVLTFRQFKIDFILHDILLPLLILHCQNSGLLKNLLISLLFILS